MNRICNKNSISFDNVCTFIKRETTQDENLNDVITDTETNVFCAELPIASNEFFKAEQSGIKASKEFVVYTEEYNDEQLIKYNDKLYSIYRIYQRPDEYTELYCESRVGNG